MMLLMSFLAYLPKIILGFSITHLIWSETKFSYIFLKLFVAAPLGVGITTFLLFFWKLLGLANTGYIVFELAIVLVVLMSVILIRWHTFKKIQFSIPAFTTWIDKALLAGVFVSILISIVSFFLTMLIHPHGSEDAWSNWNLIARYIHGSQDMTNALSYIASSVFPGYPFMIGLGVANGWIFVDDVTTRVPIAVSALFTYSIPGILFFTLTEIKGYRFASMATILVSSAWLAQAGSALYSDIPIASLCLATGAFISLHHHLKSPELLTLAGFTAGFAAWTKNDGIPFTFFATLLAILIALHEKDKKIFLKFLIGLAFPAVVLGIYKLFLAAPGDIVSTVNSPLTRLLDFSRFQIVFKHFVVTTSSYGSPPIGYVWVLLAIALAFGVNFRSKGTQYLAFLLFFQYSAYFLVYMITPLDLQWHLNTSMGRVLTHLMPLLTLFVFLSLRSLPPLDRESEGT